MVGSYEMMVDPVVSTVRFHKIRLTVDCVVLVWNATLSAGGTCTMLDFATRVPYVCYEKAQVINGKARVTLRGHRTCCDNWVRVCG